MGPSQEYIDRMAIYRSDAMGIGPRPSPYHQWIPGIGWTFMPEYDTSIQDQFNNMTGQQQANALNNGWNPELSADSQYWADQTGTTVSSAPAYLGGGGGGIWQNGQGSEPATPAPPPPAPTPSEVTIEAIYALYDKYLGRTPELAGLEYWLNSGGTLADLEWNIANSEEGLAYEAAQAGGGDGGNGGGTGTGTGTGTGGGTNNAPLGYYWANAGGGWQWFAYYQGEAPPSNAQYVSEGPEMPNGAPPGWTDPNANNGGGNEPPPQQLYTPNASMFYKGMFTAGDQLRANGGVVTSTFYDNARAKILESLAAQAAANDREQNTAEEIAIAQGRSPSYSASGLFDPSYAALLANMGI